MTRKIQEKLEKLKEQQEKIKRQEKELIQSLYIKIGKTVIKEWGIEDDKTLNEIIVALKDQAKKYEKELDTESQEKTVDNTPIHNG